MDNPTPRSLILPRYFLSTAVIDNAIGTINNINRHKVGLTSENQAVSQSFTVKRRKSVGNE